jgi:hypothetical protein
MKRPIDQIAETLAGRVRTDPSGAKSLAHLLVVVPTAQSGRRLRLALARRFGAVVPPTVLTPPETLLDASDPALAGRTDELVAFRDALGNDGKDLDADAKLRLAKQLSDLRGLLAAKAISFADVVAEISVEMPEESERWRELAETETRYLAELAKRGKTDRIAAMKTYRPNRPGIEETLRFDDPTILSTVQLPNCPTVQLSHITACATAADEAEKIAEIFAAVKPDEAYPALCVADPEMYPEVVSALKAKGIELHDPSRTRLATSALGHLVAQIAALQASPSYSVFSAFVRGGDVRRWLCAELKLTDLELADALVDLDNRQAEFLPEKIDDIAPKTTGTLRGIFEFVKVSLRKKGMRALLASIFKDRRLDDLDTASREFAAAAEAVNALVTECGDDRALFRMRLDEATYSLEPDEGDVVLTDGWMELPFLDADRLVIAGFREGCVPESTVGHPFLPDSLRHRLGLPDNASKEARDRAILNLAVGTRAEGAVRILFHSLDAKGDVLKPSRLLFETDDDADLVARVTALYGIRAGTSEPSAADLPRSWKLKLPVPPEEKELARISPTRLDGYLRCPFTFYLRDKTILGDKRLDDRAEELASWEYGNLAHEALEAFGTSELKDSADADAIAAFLSEKVDGQLVARFGTAIPAIVAMQGESVRRRLANFAGIQAARRAEGWRIAAVERKLEVMYGHTRLYGKCDRIDFKEATGEWCVIDYKTFDSADKAKSCETKRGTGEIEWKSLQLPIYCAMLAAAPDADLPVADRMKISSCYCVLGKTADDVVFTEPMSGGLVGDAEKKVLELIPRIEKGIFWPPGTGPNPPWKYDYADWLMPTPQDAVDEDWIADQERRLEEAAT